MVGKAELGFDNEMAVDPQCAGRRRRALDFQVEADDVQCLSSPA